MNGSFKDDQKEESNQIDIYPVPLSLFDINVNSYIFTDRLANLTKEEIITKAVNYHLQENITQAVKYYRYFLDQGFSDPTVFCNYGVIFYTLGKLKEAEDLLRKAIQIEPNYEQAYSNLGLVYKDLGELKKAELLIRKAIELNPDYVDAYINLSVILKELDQLQEAEKVIKKAVSIRPDNPISYYNLGNILFELDQLEEAELAIRKSIELKPNSAEAHSELGRILIEFNELEEAELVTRKAIKLQPNLADAYHNLGKILLGLGELNEAEIYTRKAIELQPTVALGHNNLASILSDLGKLEEAEVAINQAITLKPDYPEAMINRGVIFGRLGKIKESILSFKSTIELRSANSEQRLRAYLEITICNLVQGNFIETYLNFKKTEYFINKGCLNLIKDHKIKQYTNAFFNFINNLYPKLKQINYNLSQAMIPHIGESNCLSFSNQILSLDDKQLQVQPVLITGAKAWHFASKYNNQWKSSLDQQIINYIDSEKVLISFGEIDCRKDEGILAFSKKKNQDISTIILKTINLYLDYMEKKLAKFFSKRYYFGVAAPVVLSGKIDDLDIKRKQLISEYNSILKAELKVRGSYFIDVYSCTSNHQGFNNGIYMCDDNHLSPAALDILLSNYLIKP
ncbi:tetratricopeptide repeat protein [Prochlorococcus marinus]|uniref:tetratricopeptide repeat protein n=1 Tax=Prochlorococcus marinus TaxID=1219 RepID=UPI0022B2DC60|nr:tetratricopeptide repeat protein [Prochlorococcus marinus]